MEDGNNLTKSVNRELRVMRFTVHTGLKKTPFELHHGKKPRTELTNFVKDGKNTYLMVRIFYFSANQAKDTNLSGPRCGRRDNEPHSKGTDKKRRRNSTQNDQNHRKRKIRLANLSNL